MPPAPRSSVGRLFGHILGRSIARLPGAVLTLTALLAASLVAPAAAAPVRILAIGDSLTAGYGLADPADGFVESLETALEAAGHDVEVVDAGVSGDTTTGGAARLDWALGGGDDIDGAIIELGANDGLRGVDPDASRAALSRMIEGLQARGVPVLLTGMLAPPNMGDDYGARFNAIFPELAETYGTLFYPFFLEGVAALPELNQADGIHPNPEGVDVIVSNILPSVEALLARIAERG